MPLVEGTQCGEAEWIFFIVKLKFVSIGFFNYRGCYIHNALVMLVLKGSSN